MLNKVILIGHLGGDPEPHAGQKPAIFSLATSERWKDKASGEPRERTEWHRIVIFNEALAEIAEKYLKKGSKVYVEGALASRSWEDDKGIKRYSTEVLLKGFRAKLVLLDRAEGGYRAPTGEADYGYVAEEEAPY